MQICSVLEHNGEIFRQGDRVKVFFDNGNQVCGIIKDYGTMNFVGGAGICDGIHFGRYCVPLYEVKEILKVK